MPGPRVFQQWPGNVNLARSSYQFRISTLAGNVQGQIDELKLELDVPDIEEVVEDFVVANTGVSRPLLKNEYRGISHVGADIQDPQNGGISVLVIDKNPDEGPSIQVVNFNGQRVTETVDLRIRGH